MSTSGTIRLGRVWSVPVRVRPGAVLMGIVLVALFAPRLADAGFTRPWVVAVLAVASLYVSVLLHEVAHVAAARHFGLPVHSVTLHLLGGETLLESDSATARQELVTAISGPVASAVVGLAALGAGAAASGSNAAVLTTLGWINVLVAGINMLPALPLDGGRVVRALGWAVTGRERTGIVVAGWSGRLAGLASFGLGGWLFLQDRRTAWIDLALCTVVGLFLWAGSTQSLRIADRAARVERLHVRRMFDSSRPESDWPHLDVDLRGDALLRAMSQQPAEAYAVVDDDGEVLGTLRTRTVNRVYRVGARR
ncbi:MAG: site-2 protease family protein [Aeromicrobium sp.]|uniref:site-2 protease family protein n=1 Tax=Aeromicrobium sp. TaxID=1871063 RepID=UPI002624BD97|nr:site-2 protease family protein [Aeromicrobium sp.]MDF1705126.1 site-2 protease family protein [Aeromicrobium sp.]